MSKHCLMVSLVALAFPVGGLAQSTDECDCTIYPFVPAPPCYKHCVPVVAGTLPPDQLFKILRLPKQSKAEIVFNWKGGTPPTEPEKLYSKFTSNAVNTAFDKLSISEQEELVNQFRKQLGMLE